MHHGLGGTQISMWQTKHTKEGMCHNTVALPFKKYLKAKEEEWWKLKYLTIAKI
jgi:hypothetical protein